MNDVRTAGMVVEAIARLQFDAGRPEIAGLFAHYGVAPPYGYFLLRAAPLGDVNPAVVGAAFAYFPPVMVAKLVSRHRVPPDDLVARGVEAMSAAARSAYGAVAGIDELAALLDEAAGAARTEGRALAAAWQTVAWPDDAAPRVLGAATVLREHRGDGHVHALARHGLTPLQGNLLGAGRRGEVLGEDARSRGFRDAELEPALEGLAARGAVEDGKLTAAGAQLWEDAEADTDLLAAQPWRVLGDRITTAIALGETVLRDAGW